MPDAPIKESEIRPAETVNKNDKSAVNVKQYLKFRKAAEAEFDNSRLEYYDPAKDEKSIYNNIKERLALAIGGNIIPLIAPLIQAGTTIAAIASSCMPAFQTANYIVGKVPFYIKPKLLEDTGIS